MSQPPSEDELDSQFNLRERHPDFQSYFDRNESLSEESLSLHPWQTDIPYGSHKLQTLDLAASKSTDSPIFLFIHGGYWKTLDKSSHRFLANPFLEAGCAAVNVNYRLAPEVSIDGIVEDVTTAILWTSSHARELQGDPNRIYIAGHSAGAHLALMSYLRLVERAEPIAQTIHCVYCISGLYDLDLLMRSYLNAELNITPKIAKDCSPLARSEIRADTDLRFVVGEGETDVFVSQSQKMHDLATSSGSNSTMSIIENCHHFDILYELAEPKGRLCQDLLALIGAEQSP